MSGLGETVRAYYAALEGLNCRLLRIFAAALGVDADYLLARFARHASVLRAINYPEQDPPPAPGQLRCGAHSDFGTHTLLQIDDAPGGLQARARDGGWIDVSPPPGSFTVNIGDLMMVWTNDRWLSNLHRVVNPPAAAGGTRRQSIAFFVQPDYDARIECIPTCLAPGETPRHAPVTAWQHRHAKLSKTAPEANVLRGVGHCAEGWDSAGRYGRPPPPPLLSSCPDLFRASTSLHRLARAPLAPRCRKTWMPGTSPGMTTGVGRAAGPAPGRADRPSRYLHRLPFFPLRHPHLVEPLQVEPELPRGPEMASEPLRGVVRDRAAAVEDPGRCGRPGRRSGGPVRRRSSRARRGPRAGFRRGGPGRAAWSPSLWAGAGRYGR